jgi:hypothetical protein
MPRPYRQSDGGSKRTCELTSSIVPRGTSFHRSVELECPPIAFVPARFSCCCRGFSNRPFGVKHFQASHHASVDVTHGLVLLFGIGTKALPSWDSKTRWNNLCHGLTVSLTAGPSGHANSPHPSSREGHHSTARWSSSVLLLRLFPPGFHAAAAASLIGHLGSSTFRLATMPVSMSLTGSCFSSESAPRPFHHGIRRRGGTTYATALPSV